MDLYGLLRSESHPIYVRLAAENGTRQYDFLRSIVETSIAVEKIYLSQSIIKALNFHAITCLHINAGEYRPCGVTVGNHQPPPFYEVQSLMDDFVNDVNRFFSNDEVDTVTLGAFVLWRLNYIHPFINGNGRTARAACYFVICLKSKNWLPGKITLPELITNNRSRYCQILSDIDIGYNNTGEINLHELRDFLDGLIVEQLSSC